MYYQNWIRTLTMNRTLGNNLLSRFRATTSPFLPFHQFTPYISLLKKIIQQRILWLSHVERFKSKIPFKLLPNSPRSELSYSRPKQMPRRPAPKTPLSIILLQRPSQSPSDSQRPDNLFSGRSERKPGYGSGRVQCHMSAAAYNELFYCCETGEQSVRFYTIL
jgi:hypothetical protein